MVWLCHSITVPNPSQRSSKSKRQSAVTVALDCGARAVIVGLSLGFDLLECGLKDTTHRRP